MDSLADSNGNHVEADEVPQWWWAAGLTIPLAIFGPFSKAKRSLDEIRLERKIPCERFRKSQMGGIEGIMDVIAAPGSLVEWILVAMWQRVGDKTKVPTGWLYHGATGDTLIGMPMCINLEVVAITEAAETSTLYVA